MKIRREDLAAAAALGLLQNTQVDPLLVYLLHRDLRAKREQMLVQSQPQLGGVNRRLAYALGLLVLITATLFAVALMAHEEQATDVGVMIVSTVLYASGALAFVGWLRKRGLFSRKRTVAALTMASLPLAVFALHHVTG